MNNMLDDIPVAKAFAYSGRYYLYDTFTNRMLCITKEHYAEITMLQKIGLTAYVLLNKESITYKDIISLIEKGLLKTNFISKIEHPESRYIKHIIERCTKEITLQVTQNCNFECRYCSFANNNGFNRIHKEEYMTIDVAKASVNYLYNHSMDCNDVTIAFYGGEPLLNYDLIKQVVEYANHCFFSKKVNYIMTINGSILTDEMLELFIDNHFVLTFSLDGPPTIHNSHRKYKDSGNPTHDVIVKNINKIKEKNNTYFYNYVSYIAVIFDDENINEIFDYYESIDIDRSKVHISSADIRGIDYVLSPNVNDSDVSYPNDININNMQEDIYKDKNDIPPTWHHNGPCIPSMKRLFVSTNGTLYVCEKFTEEEVYSIGCIYTGIDVGKAEYLLNIGLITESECKKCWAMRFCNICPVYCLDPETKSLNKEYKLKTCKKIKEDTLEFFKQKLNKSNIK